MTNTQTNSVGRVQTKKVTLVTADNPLQLESGKSLAPVEVAYETYGTLNENKDNAVLICHALSGDAHAAGYHHESDKKLGWWDNMIGPGKGIDTDKHFVICSNVLAGCSGTTGPSSVNPQTGKPYGLDFPIITIADMVNVQKLLIDHLGIDKLLAVVGGSMGGMQVLQWAVQYRDRLKAAIVIASTTRLGAQAIAFDAVGRNAILADSNFSDGNYTADRSPDHGLAMARMIGHITYLSEAGMRKKFGRKLRSRQKYRYDFDSEFAVETYLNYQGQTFVERFDANSYLYITKAMDYFDLELQYGSLQNAFRNTAARFLIASFTSDWLFPTKQSREMVDALVAENKYVSYCNIDSPYGHDAFLLEPETLGAFISAFLDRTRSGVKLHFPVTAENSELPTDPHFAKRARVDYELIESLIEHRTRVLDTGCGDGELLARLMADKSIHGEGIEIDQGLVLECVRRGLPTIHQDIEQGLDRYADRSFDYVILSQTLQTVKDPCKLFIELLRIGKKVIVSFPNFAHWRCRFQLGFTGRAPVSRQLPFEWYDSPNMHFLSLKDFDRLCERLNVTIEQKIPLVRNRRRSVKVIPNLFAEQVIYVTSK